MNKLMSGKRGLVMGVATDRSIAWQIAKVLKKQGADLAFTYQGEALEKRVKPLAASLDCGFVEPCDVTREEDIQQVFNSIESRWGNLDFIVHAVAFADKNALTGKYLNVSRQSFLNAMDISCFSLTNLCKHAEPLLNDNSSILTLSYYGSTKVVPNYNVMGVAKAALEASVRYLAFDLGEKGTRVNAISAGPIKTLAASGIGDFREMLKWGAEISPLKRNVSGEEVAKSALYFLSDLSSGVTGEVHYVDGGYNTMGSKPMNSQGD